VAKFFFDGDKKFLSKALLRSFQAGRGRNYLGRPEQVDSDLALMRQAGLNVVRIYHAPPRWFLDRCAVAGMRVLVTLPWEKHIRVSCVKERRANKLPGPVRAAVMSHAGHPAILWFTWWATKFPARWHAGSAGVRVIEFCGGINSHRTRDRSGLRFFLRNVSANGISAAAKCRFLFVFNVYLHNQQDFEGYLLRCKI